MKISWDTRQQGLELLQYMHDNTDILWAEGERPLDYSIPVDKGLYLRNITGHGDLRIFVNTTMPSTITYREFIDQKVDRLFKPDIPKVRSLINLPDYKFQAFIYNDRLYYIDSEGNSTKI